MRWSDGVFRVYGYNVLPLFMERITFVTSCLLPWMRKSILNGVYSKRKEFAPAGANSFL